MSNEFSVLQEIRDTLKKMADLMEKTEPARFIKSQGCPNCVASWSYQKAAYPGLATCQTCGRIEPRGI